MTPEQLDILSERVEATVKKTVNGKIDRMNEKLDLHIETHKRDSEAIKKHMEDVAPVIAEFKERKIRDAFLLETGERIKWIGGVGIALGAIWLFIKGILKM